MRDEVRQMDEKNILVGIFLLIMGFAMMAMTFVYFKTKKLNLSWLTFGAIYSIGLIILFTENLLKEYLHILPTDKFYSFFSLIILFIGIMLSFIFYAKKSDRYLIAGILLSVGIHFIPFNSIYTYVLSVGLIINASLIFIKKDFPIIRTLLIDALMKITLGLFLML